MKYTVMTIAGSDSGGGAGIQADLKTILTHNLWGVSVITAITAQNTNEVKKIYRLPLDIIESQFDILIDDFNIKAIKTGMLLNSEIIKLISSKIKDLEIPIIIDPVLKSTTGTQLTENKFIESLCSDLIPYSTIITPNIYEAEIIIKDKISTHSDVESACKKIAQLGPKAVIIKGGHLNEEYSTIFDTLYYNKKFYYYKKIRIKRRFHGLGCTFSTSIACNLSKGYGIVDSVKLAQEYINTVIENSIKVAHGLIPANQKFIWI
ncbi:MAG: bifunctional hydroxymethylpyrimidine kinase/phosphomethylpyrimidine kinase [Candidatus Helarchaeota archaeon]